MSEYQEELTNITKSMTYLNSINTKHFDCNIECFIQSFFIYHKKSHHSPGQATRTNQTLR